MHNPLHHIQAAQEQVQKRQAQRHVGQVDMRGFLAAEVIADELTMIRAEMSVMRELVAMIQAKIK
jgi:hypothetical protein